MRQTWTPQILLTYHSFSVFIYPNGYLIYQIVKNEQIQPARNFLSLAFWISKQYLNVGIAAGGIKDARIISGAMHRSS